MINKPAKEGVPNHCDRKPESFEMTNDLATVSCCAASEIDNLLLGRPRGFMAIRRLIQLLQDSFISVVEPAAPQSLMDPAAAVAMNHALSAASGEGPLRTIDEVVRESQRVVEAMAQLVERKPIEVQEANRGELQRLRTLCLSLSTRVLSFEEPVDQTRPELDPSLVG